MLKKYFEQKCQNIIKVKAINHKFALNNKSLYLRQKFVSKIIKLIVYKKKIIRKITFH
jgi:hypothetical protein